MQDLAHALRVRIESGRDSKTTRIHPFNIPDEPDFSCTNIRPAVLPSFRKGTSLMYVPYKLRFAADCLSNGTDLAAMLRFLADGDSSISLTRRLGFVYAAYRASLNIDCAHTQSEMLTVVRELFSIPATTRGCMVEAGCYKGGSTAKLSLAAKLAKRPLVVFDSFAGLPDNNEQHGKTLRGETPNFEKGRYRGALDEVKSNVSRFGALDSCQFIQGWFEDTMPPFREPIVVAYLDVDLVASTSTCLKHLYPLLQPGGVILSQDGHLPRIVDLLSDKDFWQEVVGFAKPAIIGLGQRQLVHILKPA